MDFGKYIRKHRLAKGIQLKALAERVGISRAYLTQIESGTKEPPSESILAKLAAELDIPQKVLFRLANSESFAEEYLEGTIDYAELYEKITAIEKNIETILMRGGELTEKYLAQQSKHVLGELKESINEVSKVKDQLQTIATKPVTTKELPPKIARIVNELFEAGEVGQNYVLRQLEVFRQFFMDK